MALYPSSRSARAVAALAAVVGALALSATPALAQHGHGGGGWHGGGFHGHGGWHGGYGRAPLWGGVGLGIGIGLGSYYGGWGAPWYPYGDPYLGYTVVNPPTVVYDAPATAGLPSTAADAASPPVIYPRNGQTAAQIEADRMACVDWSNTQPNAIDTSVFRRAMAACMDARGYTLR